MEVFAFASENLTNIWAGIGARQWAVSPTGDTSAAAGRRTKALKMSVGSFGILYCNEKKALTTPFIVYSKPSTEKIVTDVWPEVSGWVLPFKMLPLGTPRKQMSIEEAKDILPVFKRTGKTNFSHVFLVHAQLAFQSTKLEQEDWEILITKLSDEV